MIIEESEILKQELKDVIENGKFENKFDAIEVNDDKPFTFNKEDYNVKEGKPIYTDSNKYGRSGSATAVISKNTISIYSSENIEYPEPINWDKLKYQYKILSNDKKANIYQKCHIIGYHLSAKFSNPHNIFIGTDTLNHGSMKGIEDDICREILNNDRIFLYKVTPIYMFRNDIIPIGVLFEYETIDKKEKIIHCKFCFNIEKGKKINYYNGSNINFENVEKREDNTIKEVNAKSLVSKQTNTYKNYYVDIRAKIFHVIYDEKEKCEDLKGVRKKYIQEVTGDEESILSDKDKNFKICRKCKKKFERKPKN